MYRKTWVGYLVALVLVVAAGFWFVRGDPDRADTLQDAVAQPIAVVEGEVFDSSSTLEVDSLPVDVTSVSRREALGVFPAADVVRFDPAAWPALPSDDSPIRDSAMEMLDRAERGDAGAACWLGLKLRRCHEARTFEPQLNAMNEVSKGSSNLSAKQILMLEQQAKVAEELAFCQGLDPAMISRGLEMTRQAALAGSKASIAEMMGLDGLSEASFPNAEQVRQTLDEHEAIIWAGLLAGVPESLNQLILESARYIPDSMTSPVVPDLSPDDVLALQYLLFEISQAMIREQPALGETPEVASDMAAQKVKLAKLPDARRKRIAAIVEELNISGWPDLEDVPSGLDRVKSAQTACIEFGDPVNVSVSLKDVVGP